MKRFICTCGARVFFEDFVCLACGRQLGFLPDRLEFLCWPPGSGEPVDDGAGGRWMPCANRQPHPVCNWMAPAGSASGQCLSCGLNRVIPNLGVPGNAPLWARLERAKRRLVYSLVGMGLPTEGDAAWAPLRFDFLEDQRRNPHVAEAYVTTGHHAGVITLNLLEADDSARHAAREEMVELYRTPLGHFRHETGHYYQEWLVPEGGPRDEYRELFGDERIDYAAALERYYANGPVPHWNERFVSAYASSHPVEDWAECWAHYLHITDGLETARANGLLASLHSFDWESELATWIDAAVKLNELNRSLGIDDPYPFVLTAPVREKLEFIHRRLSAVTGGTAWRAAR